MAQYEPRIFSKLCLTNRQVTPPMFIPLLALLSVLPACVSGAEFYLPADPNYSVMASARDSLRFTLEKTLTVDSRDHLVSRSSFVNPEAQVMGWHDFGNLEGPGWAANAVGGASEIFSMGEFLQQPDLQSNALAIVDHVLDCGFLDEQSGFVRAYRDTATGKFCLNYKHNSDWFCPGSMAKVGFQMLQLADAIAPDRRAARLRTFATRSARWIDQHVQSVPNNWFPRRVDPSGRIYRKSPDGGEDRFWQSSADSLYILQLQLALTQRGLADYRSSLKQKADTFIRAGGIFGSINHDTYDPEENVAFSVAFRVFLPLSDLLRDHNLRTFAFKKCLAGLDQFKMTEDRNGVATRGLLFMEKSWDTAYLWENAEAALAFFEAARATRATNSTASRRYESDGLVILRAIAKHHYGKHGFLTEGVDWNNHVGQQHHIAGTKFGAIQYTEPFLNNQHIIEPTLYYLKTLATQRVVQGRREWLDLENNVLFRK